MGSDLGAGEEVVRLLLVEGDLADRALMRREEGDRVLALTQVPDTQDTVVSTRHQDVALGSEMYGKGIFNSVSKR